MRAIAEAQKGQAPKKSINSEKSQRATTKGQNRFGTSSHFFANFHTFSLFFRIFPPGLFLTLRPFLKRIERKRPKHFAH